MISRYNLIKITMLMISILLIIRPVVAQDGTGESADWTQIFTDIAGFIADLFEKSAEMMREGTEIFSEGFNNTSE